MTFHSTWECHHPNLTKILFRGLGQSPDLGQNVCWGMFQQNSRGRSCDKLMDMEVIHDCPMANLSGQRLSEDMFVPNWWKPLLGI
jgi:hypothetical protein